MPRTHATSHREICTAEPVIITVDIAGVDGGVVGGYGGGDGRDALPALLAPLGLHLLPAAPAVEQPPYATQSVLPDGKI